MVLILAINFVSHGQQPVYLDPGQPVEKRVEDLLSRMTLEEKLGQLNVSAIRIFAMDIPRLRPYQQWLEEYIKDLEPRDATSKFVAGELIPNMGPAGGLFCAAEMRDIEGEVGPRQQAEFINQLQEIAVEKTRLKIPVLFIEEKTHGLMAPGGTIFPEGLAIGSTWNMDLVDRIYSVVAREARSRGAHGLCTIVVEPNRDPRLGRNMQGYSECPYFCSRVTETIVRSIQGEYLSDISADGKAIAVLTHFPGQSEHVGGLEGGAMEISERKLREVFLPPWVAGITKADALDVMATYPAIDGEPTPLLMETILTFINEK